MQRRCSGAPNSVLHSGHYLIGNKCYCCRFQPEHGPAYLLEYCKYKTEYNNKYKRDCQRLLYSHASTSFLLLALIKTRFPRFSTCLCIAKPSCSVMNSTLSLLLSKINPPPRRKRDIFWV